MPHDAPETDYLVVGAGATAMAFVDTLLDHSDASVTIVDRRKAPGGHWTDAYPYVRLHQPSAWYGVVSRPVPETSGQGASSEHRATGAEVLAYFDRLMHERFLPSGRVTWLPGVDYLSGDHGIHQLRHVDGGGESGHVARGNAATGVGAIRDHHNGLVRAPQRREPPRDRRRRIV